MEDQKKTEAEHKQKYEKCSLYNVGECGPHKKRSPPVDGMFSVNELTEDVTPHFISLKMIKENANNDWTEKMLIENRIGRSLLCDDMLCAYHRYKHDIWWKQPVSCADREHLQQKGKKSAKGRVATISKSLELGIPVGSILCHKHRLQKEDISSCSDALRDDPSEDNDDVDFVSPEINISSEEVDTSIEIGDTLTSALEVSPIGFRVKTKVDRLSGSTLQKLQRKIKRWQDASAKQFAASIAPGQENELMELIDHMDENGTVPVDDVPNDVEEIVSLYNNSDSMSRIVILP